MNPRVNDRNGLKSIPRSRPERSLANRYATVESAKGRIQYPPRKLSTSRGEPQAGAIRGLISSQASIKGRAMMIPRRNKRWDLSLWVESQNHAHNEKWVSGMTSNRKEYMVQG
jgi:hypothetical protein